MIIERENKNYGQFVDNSDPSHYLIYLQKLENGDSIQCPNDPNMILCKREGKIFMTKKGYGKIEIQDA